MPRAKNAVASRRRRKKVLKKTKGFYASRSRQYRSASVAMLKAMHYSYRDRRAKKRQFRRLWIVRINAAARQNGISYSDLICGLKRAGNSLNRKVLAELAMNDPSAFSALAEQAKAALAL